MYVYMELGEKIKNVTSPLKIRRVTLLFSKVGGIIYCEKRDMGNLSAHCCAEGGGLYIREPPDPWEENLLSALPPLFLFILLRLGFVRKTC